MHGRGTKQVLNVGQCQPDHNSIRQFVQAEFGAEVEYCADISAAMKRLCDRASFSWYSTHNLTLPALASLIEPDSYAHL